MVSVAVLVDLNLSARTATYGGVFTANPYYLSQYDDRSSFNEPTSPLYFETDIGVIHVRELVIGPYSPATPNNYHLGMFNAGPISSNSYSEYHQNGWNQSGSHTQGFISGTISTWYIGQAPTVRLGPIETVTYTDTTVVSNYNLENGAPQTYTKSNTWQYYDYIWVQLNINIAPEAPPIVSATGPSSVIEADKGTQDAIYTVSLDRPVSYAVSVSFATVDGSAVAGEDYSPRSGSITFAPGQTSRKIPVPIVGDTRPEANGESFSFTISNPSASGGPTPVVNPAGATVSTSIVDPQVLSEAQNVIGLLAEVNEVTHNAIKLIVGLSTDATIPLIAADLQKLDKLMGPAEKALGWSAAVADPLLALRENLNSASQLDNPLAREQAEWTAYKQFDVEVFDGLAKTAFGVIAGAYATAYATAATAGGIELALAAFAGAAGVTISVPLIISTGAAIAVGVVAAEYYDEFISPIIRDHLTKEFEANFPAPTEPAPSIQPLSLGIDAGFYNGFYPDVAAAGMSPESHYDQYGWREGRDPNALFSSKGYLAANPDVAAADTNPLRHYLEHGWKEGRDPGEFFDTDAYLAQNADVKAAGIDPLTHFLLYGAQEGRQSSLAVMDKTPTGNIDDAFYFAKNPDVAASGMTAAEHFHSWGWKEGRAPSNYFDTDGYLSANPDVKAAGVNPLEHYNDWGWKEGRPTGSLFDGVAYLSANPDVEAAGMNPLEHFMWWGINEGRGSGHSLLDWMV